MKQRIKRLIALFMIVMMLNQMPGFGALIAMAAEISVTTSNYTVTTSTTDTYVFGSGSSQIDINSGVSIGGLTSAISGTYDINNSGTIDVVTVSQFNSYNLNGGSYGTIDVAQDATVTGTNITAGTIISNGTLNLEGTNNITTELYAFSVTSTGTINVGKDTSITVLADDVTVYYDERSYTILAGSEDTSVGQEYGAMITFSSEDGNVNWVASDGTDNLNNYLMAGDTTGTYICTPAEGYYFPESYAVTTDGASSPTVTRVSDSELQVEYTVADTDTGTVTISFPKLTKILIDGSGSLTVEDIIFGGTVNPQIVSETNPYVDPVVEYKVAGADESVYDVSVPSAVGSYDARVILPANDTYKELILTTSFDISKAPGQGEFSVEDIVYGETVNPQYSSTTQDTAGAVVEYKINGEDDTTYSEIKPTAVGSYTARVTVPASESYDTLVLTDEFTIGKAVGDVTFTVEDVEYGEEVVPNVESAVYEISSAVIRYKESGADDSTYTTVVPTLVGNYIAQITFAANESYEELVATAEFEITKAAGEASITVEDVTYGETVTPVVTSATHEVETGTIEYKLASQADTAYTATVPEEVGSYVARVTFAANESYNGIVATAEFNIIEAPEEEPEEEPEEAPEEEPEEAPEEEPGEVIPEEDVKVPVTGSGSIVVNDVYYGTTINPQITSTTNTISGVKVEYKIYGNNDSTYTTKKPTATGKYVARVVLPANEGYKELVLTDEFTISYLPIPDNSYSLIGNVGDNGYYTSSVSIVAKNGYAISTSLDGEYVERMTISTSRESMIVYLMEKNTGAKTNGLTIGAINIDMDAPQVDANGDNTYYGDSFAVVISDNNLASINLNGKNVDVDGIRTILELKSNGGVEEYLVVVADNAGHTKTMVITVAAEWTKTGEIPNGSQVKLKAGTSYSLGSGTWTVNGDATSYSGNTTFYVKGESQFIFNQQ